ncbi:hypothetical protein SAMN05421882_103926 [Nitrosomonas communis]|uniref:Uncharacterized protein n=1 Tax=Nitrosomonas communis TaxID=44574 RepID=A0A1H2XJC3_9PROT|nr:hypothetical protein SAMN05421882_103926 [Nitrosomonas communis]
MHYSVYSILKSPHVNLIALDPSPILEVGIIYLPENKVREELHAIVKGKKLLEILF